MFLMFINNPSPQIFACKSTTFGGKTDFFIFKNTPKQNTDINKKIVCSVVVVHVVLENGCNMHT